MFPVDDTGKPTFQPSAEWYLSKVDFNNALSYETISPPTVKRIGADLHVILYFKGTFFENIELEDFPFDTQAAGPPGLER